MKEIPKFYNDLDLTLKEIKYLLSRGVKDRKSNFHYTVLSTIKNYTPESRTVILRSFNEEIFELNVHSDLRSDKIDQIEKNNKVSCLFYDDKKKIQIRITEKPGSEVLEPTQGFPDEFINNSPDDDNSIKGLKNFTIIKIIISKIEWLFLASQGHRRAKFEIDREGSLTKISRKWLVP